jgi:hypothetical protein
MLSVVTFLLLVLGWRQFESSSLFFKLILPHLSTFFQISFRKMKKKKCKCLIASLFTPVMSSQVPWDCLSNINITYFQNIYSTKYQLNKDIDTTKKTSTVYHIMQKLRAKKINISRKKKTNEKTKRFPNLLPMCYVSLHD